MNDELFKPDEVLSPSPRRRISRKQGAVLAALHQKYTITLAEATALIGADIYANRKKHVGALLANMVRRGMLARHKRGVFRLPIALLAALLLATMLADAGPAIAWRVHYSIRGSGRDVTVLAQSSQEARRTVADMFPGAVVTGARPAWAK